MVSLAEPSPPEIPDDPRRGGGDGWGGFPAAGGLFQLRLAEEGRRVSTTNRARSVGLEKGIGSVWNVGIQENNFLFWLRTFFSLWA